MTEALVCKDHKDCLVVVDLKEKLAGMEHLDLLDHQDLLAHLERDWHMTLLL